MRGRGGPLQQASKEEYAPILDDKSKDAGMIRPV